MGMDEQRIRYIIESETAEIKHKVEELEKIIKKLEKKKEEEARNGDN